jgi:hypothetical protein
MFVSRPLGPLRAMALPVNVGHAAANIETIKLWVPITHVGDHVLFRCGAAIEIRLAKSHGTLRPKPLSSCRMPHDSSFRVDRHAASFTAAKEVDRQAISSRSGPSIPQLSKRASVSYV